MSYQSDFTVFSHLEVFELHGPDCVVGEDLLALELHLEEAVGDSGLGAHVLRPVHVALATTTLLRRTGLVLVYIVE